MDLGQGSEGSLLDLSPLGEVFLGIKYHHLHISKALRGFYLICEINQENADDLSPQIACLSVQPVQMCARAPNLRVASSLNLSLPGHS